jgi:hypothetical protein
MKEKEKGKKKKREEKKETFEKFQFLNVVWPRLRHRLL